MDWISRHFVFCLKFSRGTGSGKSHVQPSLIFIERSHVSSSWKRRGDTLHWDLVRLHRGSKKFSEAVHPLTVKAEIKVKVIKIAFKDKILLFLEENII